MNKFVLGSGINGLIARHVLGPSYKIIPFKKSRYYSFNIPTADAEIKRTDETTKLLDDLAINAIPLYFPVAVSLGGELLFNKKAWIGPVIDKIYGDNPHPLASHLLCNEGSAFIAAKFLHDLLLDKYSDEIKRNINTVVSSIKDHYIVINDKPTQYDSIISTIPLNALMNICGMQADLESSDYYLFLINTNFFNLEGAQRVFIGDKQIPFWKVNMIGDGLYQFFSNESVPFAEELFSRMTKNRYKIIAETSIKEAFPLGAPPAGILSRLEEDGITCIGSNARWDYFYDIATSIRKLFSVQQ